MDRKLVPLSIPHVNINIPAIVVGCDSQAIRGSLLTDGRRDVRCRGETAGAGELNCWRRHPPTQEVKYTKKIIENILKDQKEVDEE